jgi:hypothetical protein
MPAEFGCGVRRILKKKLSIYVGMETGKGEIHPMHPKKWISMRWKSLHTNGLESQKSAHRFV